MKISKRQLRQEAAEKTNDLPEHLKKLMDGYHKKAIDFGLDPFFAERALETHKNDPHHPIHGLL